MEEKGSYEGPQGEKKPKLDHKEQVNKMSEKVIQSRGTKQSRGTQLRKNMP